MPDSSTRSARARRIEIRASRRLQLWWLTLHVVIAFAVFLASASAGIVALPLLALHGLARRPAPPPVVIEITPDGRFGLPDENRSNLTLTRESRSGPGWLRLSFADRPGQRLLLLRDQVDAGGWRLLRIAIQEGR